MSAGLILGVAAQNAAYDWDDPQTWVPDLVVGLTFIGAAAAMLPRRQGTSWLLAATGFAWFAGNFDGYLQYLHRGPLVHALVAFVGWRVRTRTELVAVVVGYVAAVAAPIWRNDTSSIILAVGLVTVAAYRWATATGRSRGDRRTALSASAIFAGAVTAYVIVTGVVPAGDAVEPLLVVYEVALCTIAVLLAVRVSAPSAAAVADLVVELGESRLGTLRDALADVLGDPSLEIVYWSPTGDYRDSAGRPQAGGDRMATFVEHESGPVAAIIHDASMLDEPSLVRAVAAATQLAAANATLTAEVHAQISDVAASRKRLVIAADDERRRLELRLHDGVEQCITELIDQLRNIAGKNEREHIRRAEGHLMQTIVDLRQIARGLHPSELALGLPSAVASLADRCPVRVELAVEAGPTPPQEVATAAYYVCAEALANVVKHATAGSVCLELTERLGWLHVAVTDDGSGGADRSRGSGISGLVDRVEALGGTLTVSSPVGRGTHLVAELPLDHQAR